MFLIEDRNPRVRGHRLQRGPFALVPMPSPAIRAAELGFINWKNLFHVEGMLKKIPMVAAGTIAGYAAGGDWSGALVGGIAPAVLRKRASTDVWRDIYQGALYGGAAGSVVGVGKELYGYQGNTGIAGNLAGTIKSYIVGPQVTTGVTGFQQTGGTTGQVLRQTQPTQMQSIQQPITSAWTFEKAPTTVTGAVTGGAPYLPSYTPPSTGLDIWGSIGRVTDAALPVVKQVGNLALEVALRTMGQPGVQLVEGPPPSGPVGRFTEVLPNLLPGLLPGAFPGILPNGGGFDMGMPVGGGGVPMPPPLVPFGEEGLAPPVQAGLFGGLMPMLMIGSLVVGGYLLFVRR